MTKHLLFCLLGLIFMSAWSPAMAQSSRHEKQRGRSITHSIRSSASVSRKNKKPNRRTSAKLAPLKIKPEALEKEEPEFLVPVCVGNIKRAWNPNIKHVSKPEATLEELTVDLKDIEIQPGELDQIPINGNSPPSSTCTTGYCIKSKQPNGGAATSGCTKPCPVSIYPDPATKKCTNKDCL